MDELKAQLTAANQLATIYREDHEKVRWFYGLLFIFIYVLSGDGQIEIAAGHGYTASVWRGNICFMF